MNHRSGREQSPSIVLSKIRSLFRRESRQAEQLFWLEGVRSFIQAYDAGFEFQSLVISPRLIPNPVVDILVRRLRSRGVPVVRLSPEMFRSVSATPHASGIGAICRQRWHDANRASADRGIGWLVIEGMRSSGNLGTILRTADAVGVTGVIIADRVTDPYDPTVVRASMGGVFRVRLARLDRASLVKWVRRHNVCLVGTRPQAEHLWTEMPIADRMAIAIGEEREGLSPELQSLCRVSVRLPMCGHADSLNVGVAAGVVLYELVRRQRQ